MRIVHHRHAAICSLEPPAARPRGLRRQATAATAQPLPTTAALPSRRSGHTATRPPTTITARQTACVLTIPLSGCNRTIRPTTIAAAIRSRAPTVRHPHVRTRRRNLIPHRAAATRLRPAPTPPRARAIRLRRALIPRRARAIRLRRALIPRRAPAIAAGVAAIAVVMAAVIAAVAAEAHAAAGVPALTDTTNSFSILIALPDLPDGLIVFRRHLQLNSPRLTSS